MFLSSNSKQIDESHSKATQLALSFGSIEVIGQKSFYETAKVRFPIADIVMCSTSGKILNDDFMNFTVDIPVGSVVRFMAFTHEKLVEAAYNAAFDSKTKGKIASFVHLVSCFDRKLVMGPSAIDEKLAVKKGFNKQTKLLGFYSNGEIAPFKDESNCQLLNQTMNITAIFEKNKKKKICTV